MPMLYLRCKACGIEFASEIGADKDSFESNIFENPHICPKGHTHTYYTKDYYFKD